eukprot:TRINITY_DN317_c0_g1_i4.p2 TRINITY_DN317_c0_g1~~TRINITY_DN317_c0_g1_i4.p2  ORF type:complete len:133 (-),score=23.20 TRINITY_DN317_c0_g1_i4:25-423(-)
MLYVKTFKVQMNEAIDAGMDNYGSEEDIDKAYSEVCDEVGIQLSMDVAGPGAAKIEGAPQKGGMSIEERLNELKQQFKVLISDPVSYTHLRAHETSLHLVCRLLLEKKKKKQHHQPNTANSHPSHLSPSTTL